MSPREFGVRLEERQPRIRGAAGILGLSMGLASILLFLIRPPVHVLLLVLLFGLCILPWFLWKREPNIFAPVYYMSVFLMLIYPLRILMILLLPDYVVSDIPLPYESDLLMKGMFYTIFGILVYLLVYYKYKPAKLLPRRLKDIAFRGSLRGWPAKILLVYLAGWAVRGYQIATGNYRTFLRGAGYDPTTFTLLSYFAELGEIAYILTWVYWFLQRKRDPKCWLLLLFVTLVEAGYAVAIQASKIPLVRLGVFPIMAGYLLGKRIRGRIWIPVVACVVLLVFPYIQMYREIYLARFGGELQVSLGEDFSIAREAVLQMYSQPGYYGAGLSSDAPFWLMSGVVFLNRWQGFDSLAVVLENVPDRFGYVYGRDLLLAPFALIPRAIWQDKPVSDVQTIFDQQIFSCVLCAISPYPIAEGYFNGGLFGVAGVMFSLAFLQKLLYSGFFQSRKKNPLAVVAYIWLFIWVVEIGTWVLPLFTYLVQRIAVLVLVCMLFSRKKTLLVEQRPYAQPQRA